MTAVSEQEAEPIYAGGFVAGLLTARYFALRHPINEGAFLYGAPSEIPSTVYLILERLPRVTVDHYLFAVGWRSLDHLLLCNTSEELDAALACAPGLSFH